MEPSFWRARWAENRIGFHEGRVNAHLERWWPTLGAAGRTVFVPLCGKAEDLAWLAAQGHPVVGVELVPTALEQFFAEHGWSPDVQQVGPFTRYTAQGLTLYAGDFFALTPAHLLGASAFYDRAANIALPPALRAAYVRHLRTLLPVGSPGLLVTVEYDQALRGGPPFSVPDAETRAAWAGATALEPRAEVAASGPIGEVGAKELVYTVQV